ncbi:MAG TPA: hypothetical protein VHA06_22250 [Candidatus Angelobacter sp.]|jgi:hypothetical protein|nr:hypothetical protein [Candidatus Angelobacter sp.]
MLAKCANPSCSTPLLYLREGKIFMIESSPSSPGSQSSVSQPSTSQPPLKDDVAAPVKNAVATPLKNDIAAPLKLTSKAQNRVEHFWLCGSCSSSLTVIFDRQHGVQVVPKTIPRPSRAAS